MVRQKLLSLAVVVAMFSAFAAQGQADSSSKDEFVVGPGQVLVPKGVFLLVRKGNKVGAIRFISIEQGKEIGTGRATYESYFKGDGSTSFRSQSVHKQTGSIDLKPLKGIGRAAFQFGKDKVRVGDWAFRSDSPGSIDMWPYRGAQKDYGYEFAPTSARDVTEIDLSDKRLRWFRFEKDSRVTLRVIDLPK